MVGAFTDSLAPTVDLAQGTGLRGGTKDADDATTSSASIALARSSTPPDCYEMLNVMNRCKNAVYFLCVVRSMFGST